MDWKKAARNAAEQFVREQLTQEHGQVFSEQACRLSAGGKFMVDAVSDDRKIYALVTTSLATTISGRTHTGALRKINEDIFKLSMIENKEARFLLCFTEASMAAEVQKKQMKGQLPAHFIIRHCPLPNHIQFEVERARDHSRGEQGA